MAISDVYVKETATLLNIYYFTSIFKGISLGLKQFIVVYNGQSNKYNNFKQISYRRRSFFSLLFPKVPRLVVS